VARPTPSEVLELIGLDLHTSVVESFIDAAELLIEPCSDKLGAGRRTAVLKWVTAHLIYSTNDYGTVSSESHHDVSVSYARPEMGEGLMGTMYGQQAILLADCLKRIGKTPGSVQVI
jgi:hypothetical protein